MYDSSPANAVSPASNWGASGGSLLSAYVSGYWPDSPTQQSSQIYSAETPVPELTLREAAQTLGVSPRTVQRRIQDGTLSGHKRQRGKQQVWVVDTAELARYASSSGHALTTPDSEWRRISPSDEVVIATHLGETSAVDDRIASLTAALTRQTTQIRELQVERDWLREHVGRLTLALPPAQPEARVEALEQENHDLRATLQKLSPEKRRPSWWERLFGGKQHG